MSSSQNDYNREGYPSNYEKKKKEKKKKKKNT